MFSKHVFEMQNYILIDHSKLRFYQLQIAECDTTNKWLFLHWWICLQQINGHFASVWPWSTLVEWGKKKPIDAVSKLYRTCKMKVFVFTVGTPVLKLIGHCSLPTKVFNSSEEKFRKNKLSFLFSLNIEFNVSLKFPLLEFGKIYKQNF